jgi:hypothetical protein
MTTAIRSVPRWFRVRPRLGSARRLGVLLVAIAVATLVSPSARAGAGNRNAVPMCSSDGRSVIAPPIVLPFHLVTLEAPAPCPHSDGLLALSIADDHQRAPSNPPAPDAPRAVPVRAGDLASPEAARLREACDDSFAGRELVHDLYRPPRG